MKARIEVPKCYVKQVNQQCDEYIKEQMNKKQLDLIRQTLKIVSVCLHNDFGFGGQRLYKTWENIIKTSEEIKQDSVAWKHIDDLLTSLGLPIELENYEVMDE